MPASKRARVGGVLAVVADLGGAGAPSFRPVDAATFDTVMAGWGASVRVPAPGRPGAGAAGVQEAALPLRRLADFHPDAVVAAIPGLALLRQARAMAPEPLRAGGGAPVVPPSPAAWQATVDRLLDDRVRAILHHPRVRAIEAAWRGLDALVRGLAGLADAAVHVLDLPAGAVGDGTAVAAAVAGLPGPVRALVCGWDVGPDATDLALLDALGGVAAGAGVPCLAGATPALLGCADAAALGAAAGGQALGLLARSTGLSSVALVVPRVLIRPWYDPSTVTAFAFDEAAAPGAMPFWGGSAFVAALGLALGAAGESRLVPWPAPARVEAALGEPAAAHLAAEGCLVLIPPPGSAAFRMIGSRTLGGRLLVSPA